MPCNFGSFCFRPCTLYICTWESPKASRSIIMTFFITNHTRYALVKVRKAFRCCVGGARTLFPLRLPAKLWMFFRSQMKNWHDTFHVHVETKNLHWCSASVQCMDDTSEMRYDTTTSTCKCTNACGSHKPNSAICLLTWTIQSSFLVGQFDIHFIHSNVQWRIFRYCSWYCYCFAGRFFFFVELIFHSLMKSRNKKKTIAVPSVVFLFLLHYPNHDYKILQKK